MADEARRRHVGDAVHLRGLVEFSNYCTRGCLYCGLRVTNRDVQRYRMNEREIMQTARLAEKLGYGTVVLQSGEDAQLDIHWLAHIICRIRQETPLAVTLSIGERTEGELAALRRAGADRYLLRFETSNRCLFDLIHPPRPGQECDRIDLLDVLRNLGYEVGSGVMVGIPGQTWDDLANDLLRFQSLDLDMIGVGPFLPHPGTPLGHTPHRWAAPPDEQVFNSDVMTYKVVALTRLLCPQTNIPATTALATVDPDQGRLLALQRGANVVMPNLTPAEYRAAYAIYPGKTTLADDPQDFTAHLARQIASIGRTIGQGRGDSPNITSRRSASSVV
jgi:biotin synthase